MLPCGRVLHHFDRCIRICLGGGQAWLFMCQSHMEAPAKAEVGTETRGDSENLVEGAAQVLQNTNNVSGSESGGWIVASGTQKGVNRQY